MKLLIRLLVRILFPGKTLKTFPAFLIPEGKIEEQVFLSYGTQEMEITQKHCIVCHDPFLIAIHVDLPNGAANQGSSIIVKTNSVVHAKAHVVFHGEIAIENERLGIYRVDAAINFTLSPLRQFILLRYFKNKDTLLQGRFYAALYSFPRRVIIVSYKEPNYFNIFPMDFQCLIVNGNFVVLGLRTTNTTLKKIVLTRQLVISGSDSVSLSVIYQLGRNHSSSPPSLAELPFPTIESELYHAPIPSSSTFYQEIEIVDNRQMGSHMLLFGRVVNTKILQPKGPSVYHLHFFQAAVSNYSPA